MDPESFLKLLFETAVAKAQPAQCLPPFLEKIIRPSGRTVVFGAGKASAAMAQVAERHLAWPLEGLVVTRYGHAVPCQQLEIVEAGHPVPDQNGVTAAARMLETAAGLNRNDLALCLISGGGSSLLSLPAPGLSLPDKQCVTTLLLKSGATIHEMNCVRKHLSAIKGGKLAAETAPAKLLMFAISDVVGDDLAVIASGPTVADSSTFEDALEILLKYNIQEPLSVLQHLQKAESETLKVQDQFLKNVENYLIATPMQSLEAAAQVVSAAGMKAQILGDNIEGESGKVAQEQAAIALAVQQQLSSDSKPTVLLSGGETSVKVSGSGRGGPNTEFLLTLMQELQGRAGIWALACDTDGIDGTEDNAGALITPQSFIKASNLGLEPAVFLADNDAYSFFEALGDLVSPGPTMTNVNDFRAILVMSQ
ncbi:MAG: glycerate kinase [SAR324 cluster bacterium]|nr:glycerate kinase [SAR324 cluster bacterium]MBL7035623.1 glycerate kinase [SAR324 cluster bacterium]